MTAQDDSERLSRIATQWSLVLKAHGESAAGADSARAALLEHYSPAVYRYLLGAVRDPHAAEDLSQEFALRLLRGSFKRAAPQRGRFRDYTKSVLVNLVNDHFRARKRQPLAAAEAAEAAAATADPAAPTFEACLHETVLARTWTELERKQPRYHEVLLLRVEQPELTSSQAAEELTATGGTRWTADRVRKTLERARVMFADLLLDEVAASFDCADEDDLAEALAELDLLKYCRSALERRQTKG